jgi:periplasmic protein TonB
MSEASTKKGGMRRIAVLAIITLAALALLGWGVSALLGGKSKPPPKAPKITLLAPPPPPPPPKEEKKPDPPKEQKEIKVEQPLPKPAPPQPSPELKMDGPAGNGSSAFAAGQITNEDLSKAGSGNGMFNPFSNYANLLKGDLQRYLGKNSALRRRAYTIEVHVWVASGGKLKRFELVGSTGDSDMDGAIQQAMSSLTGFKQMPPPNMPQPIRLRIVAAG